MDLTISTPPATTPTRSRRRRVTFWSAGVTALPTPAPSEPLYSCR